MIAKPENTQKETRARAGRRIAPRLAALAAALVAAVVGVLVWRARTPVPADDEVVEKPTPAQTNAPAATPRRVAEMVAETNTVEKIEAPKDEFVKRPGAMQLPDGRVLTFPPPRQGETRTVYANGRMYVCDSEGGWTDVTKRQLFHTAFEANFLALAVEGRQFIPAFLTGLDQEEVKKILAKDYQAIGDETEEEMAQLKAYDDMRCAALQYMEEGGSFDDFVMDFANYERQSREANAMCLREVMTLCKEGKIEEAKATAEAARKLMDEKGLRPFKLPKFVQTAFDQLP